MTIRKDLCEDCVGKTIYEGDKCIIIRKANSDFSSHLINIPLTAESAYAKDGEITIVFREMFNGGKIMSFSLFVRKLDRDIQGCGKTYMELINQINKQ